MTVEDAKKMKEALVDQDIIYYFNLKNGLKTLAHSLKFNLLALDLLQTLLDGDIKL